MATEVATSLKSAFGVMIEDKRRFVEESNLSQTLALQKQAEALRHEGLLVIQELPLLIALTLNPNPDPDANPNRWR